LLDSKRNVQQTEMTSDMHLFIKQRPMNN
jgi:hypothetical protein